MRVPHFLLCDGRSVVSYWRAFFIAFAVRMGALALFYFSPHALALYRVTMLGHGVSTFFHYPGYSVTISVLTYLSFGSVFLFALYHVLLHSLIGPLVLAFVRELGFDHRVATLSVWGVALLPYYVSTCVFQPQAGIVYTLVVAALWMSFRAIRLGLDWRSLFYVSLFYWGMYMYRPEAVLIVALVLGLLLIYHVFFASEHRFQLGYVVRRGLVLVACFGCWLMLTFAGNYVVSGHFGSPLPHYFGRQLWQGNNPYVMDYVTAYTQSLYIESYYSDHPLPEHIEHEPDLRKQDRMRAQLAYQFMRENPWFIVKIDGLKFLRYWDYRLDDADAESTFKNLLYSGPYSVYALCAVLGLVSLFYRRDYVVASFFLVVLGSHSLLMAVLITSIRYRMIFEYLLIILAAYAVISVWDSVYERRRIV